MKLGVLGIKKSLDKESHNVKGYFVYLYSDIDPAFGDGCQIVAPHGWSCLYLTLDDYNKYNLASLLKVGKLLEGYSVGGRVAWDSLKEVSSR